MIFETLSYMFCKAQRVTYIEQRNLCPTMRFRSDGNQLGPRTTITVNTAKRSSLEEPEVFWVELDQFKKDNPGRVVKPEEIVVEWVRGKYTEGINVQTGRAGYHRRVTAQDKIVNREAEMYTSDLEVSETAANSFFQQAVKKTMPSVKALDIAELPCNRLFSMMLSGSSGISATASSSDALPLPMPPSCEPEPLCDGMPGSGPAQPDDEDDAAATAGKGFQDALAFALPAAKAKAIATAAAKAAAAKVKSENIKEKGKNQRKKRKESEVVVEKLDQEPSSKTRRLNNDQDEALMKEFTGKLDVIKTSSLSEMGNSDASVQDAIKKALKDITGFNQSVKTKLKSLKRRKDHPETLSKALDELTTEATSMHKALTGILSYHSDDLAHVQILLQHRESGWTFASALLKRAFKSAMLCQLKFEDWESMTSESRPLMISSFGEELGSDTFDTLINELMQRLLRSLQGAKVS